MVGVDQDDSVYRISLRSKKWDRHFVTKIQEKLVYMISAWKNVIIMKQLMTVNIFLRFWQEI